MFSAHLSEREFPPFPSLVVWGLFSFFPFFGLPPGPWPTSRCFKILKGGSVPAPLLFPLSPFRSVPVLPLRGTGDLFPIRSVLSPLFLLSGCASTFFPTFPIEVAPPKPESAPPDEKFFLVLLPFSERPEEVEVSGAWGRPPFFRLRSGTTDSTYAEKEPSPFLLLSSLLFFFAETSGPPIGFSSDFSLVVFPRFFFFLYAFPAEPAPLCSIPSQCSSRMSFSAPSQTV